jgi:8-oxo-dGTP diphosphatase
MQEPEKITRVAVRAIIRDSTNRVLIIKRGNTKYGNNRWCLPGGKVDFNVTVIENLENEIKEETSLDCLSHRFLFYLDTLPSEDSDMHFVSLVFQCEVSGEIKLNDESKAFAWVAPNEMQKFDFVFDTDRALERFWEEASEQ